jgi:hypothetical protein
MKALWRIAFLALALAIPAVATAQEEVDPPPVGGGTSYTRTANGQVVEVTTVGPCEVQFTEISIHRVRGLAVRVAGTSAVCTATIRWVNRGIQTTVQLDAVEPMEPFSMESGDVDKRTGGAQSQ